MSNQNYATLTLELGQPVAHIRFTRPTLANRFDEPAHVDFVAALQAVGSDLTVRALILSAEGKVFSAGGDFDEIVRAREDPSIRQRMTQLAKAVFNALTDLQVPVIAAVQGAAAGLGATIVSLCDIAVASRQAKIADPHVAIGLVAGDGGIIGWSQSVGINRAKRYLLTGEAITAEHAHAMGMISDLVETPDAALPRAQEIAKHIAELPRAGVEGTKRAFARQTHQTANLVLDLGLALEMDSMTHPDVAEIIKRMRK
jgi:enoyl-CoA hydratase